MGVGKRIIKSQAAQRAFARLAAWYVRLVAGTTRWTVESRPLDDLLARGEEGILCFWHGRLLMMPLVWKDRRPSFYMMISQHRDGLLGARAIAHMDLRTVGADSKTGSMSALREMKRRMDAGGWVGITPDGPRGPRMRAKPGAIKLAQLSGRPLLPVTVATSRRRVLGSWDRFALAWPFGRGMILFGEPIRVPRGADAAALESARLQLEDLLNTITAEADRRCGVESVLPAPETRVGAAAGADEADRPTAGSA